MTNNTETAPARVFPHAKAETTSCPLSMVLTPGRGHDLEDYRVVLCEACGSEGRILTSDGGPYDTDHGECPWCEGTGGELIPVQPIEAEDFMEAFGS